MGRLATVLVSIFLTGAVCLAGNFKLYLKDGSDQLVREYQVQGDRVRYYSIERSQWEEVPLELVDLDRTDREHKRLEEEARKLTEEDRVERDAERQGHVELQRVPLDDGVYWVNGEQVTPLKQSETVRKGNKRRSVLKVLSPIPVVSGKATIELAGTQSQFVVSSPTPQFYLRLDKAVRFGIARLTLHKDSRIVENLTIVPIVKQEVGEQNEVEVFRQQLAPSVYKIWPVEPLQPGEYAVVQFTQDQDQVNLRVWDFAYRKP